MATVSSSLKSILLLCVVLALLSNYCYAQSNKLTIKNKDQNGDNAPYLKIGIGGTYPCGLEFAISLEDEARFIFSAASAFNATLLVPNDTIIDFPGDGIGDNGKRASNLNLYQNSLDRIRGLKVGNTNGAFGEKWAIASKQLSSLYPSNTFDIVLDGKPRTAFDQSNLFFEMLIAIQVLAEKNETLTATVVSQNETLTLLNDRLESLENYLNIDNTIDPRPNQHTNPNKTWGEVSINPNPNTNGILRVAYQINEAAKNVKLSITDIQGKAVYESLLNTMQNKGNQNIAIDLPAGTYLYYLESRAGKTKAQKLIIL